MPGWRLGGINRVLGEHGRCVTPPQCGVRPRPHALLAELLLAFVQRLKSRVRISHLDAVGPCRNGGSCSLDLAAPPPPPGAGHRRAQAHAAAARYGYSCSCPPAYTGERYEVAVQALPIPCCLATLAIGEPVIL